MTNDLYDAYRIQLGLAEGFIRKGMLTEAAEHAELAIGNNPDGLKAQAILGECRLADGLLRTATNLLTEAAKYDPVAAADLAIAQIKLSAVDRGPNIYSLGLALRRWAYEPNRTGRRQSSWRMRLDFLVSINTRMSEDVTRDLIKFLSSNAPSWMPVTA